MGTRKLVLSAAAVIFLLIAVASLYRLLVGFPITIGGQEIGQVITFLVLVVSIAFHVGRIDNLAYLLDALFDAARWPSTVFRGAIRIAFTFVLPLGLMTTYPPLALLGRLSPSAIVGAVAVAIGLVFASRLVWLRAVRAYRSAGG